MASSSNKWLLSCVKRSKWDFGTPEKWEVNRVVLQKHLQTAASSSPPWPVLINLNCYKTGQKNFREHPNHMLDWKYKLSWYLHVPYISRQQEKRNKKEIFGTDARQRPNRPTTPERLFINPQTASALSPVGHLWNDEVLPIFMIWKEPEISAHLEFKPQYIICRSHLTCPPRVLPGLLPQR